MFSVHGRRNCNRLYMCTHNIFNQVGEIIVGNLEKYGWVIMSGLTADTSTETAINNIAIKGSGKERTWASIKMKGSGKDRARASIEMSAENYKMKYDINSRIYKNWDTGCLNKLLSNIKEKIFDKIFKNANYMIGQHDLLKNDGIVKHDQILHSNYLMRLSDT